MRRINLITRDVETELFAGHPCDTLQRVASLDEARALVEQGTVGDGPATLDLIAHTTRDQKLLRVGIDVLDMFKAPVRAFFERLAADGVLAAHGSSRSGCSGARARGRTVADDGTAGAHARRGGVRNDEAADQEDHFDQRGFNPAFEHILVTG